MAFSPFLTLSVVTEPLYTTMRSPLECVETHRLVISRFCQLLDRVEFFHISSGWFKHIDLIEPPQNA